MKQRSAPWWWILILYSPVLAYYASHFAAALLHPGIIATGFIQYDLPYSMACAREFADNGLCGLLFTLPSNAGDVGEPVLLQLHLWALGQIWRLFPVDPGMLYVFFGMVTGLLAVRAFVRFFDAVVPTSPNARRWGHLLLLWGGGLLALLGEGLNIIQGRPIAETWTHLLDLDPAHGWWMMSLGRCMLLPNEAYYHLLFYTAALAFIRKRPAIAVFCLLVLAASHPFAGVGGMLVFFTWSLVERFVQKDAVTPAGVPIALVSAFALCCWYYFAWLPSRMDPQLTASMPSAYIVEARSILPAYLLVLLPACARLRTRQRLRDLIAERSSRMLLLMALVQFTLENHDLFFITYQPAHFTRGYTWTALFLIGAPWVLNEGWPWIKTRWPRARFAIAAAFTLLFLSDNVAFFALNTKRQLRASQPGFWLTHEQKEVLAFLNGLPADAPLVISQEEELGYMVIVYTPLKAYRSHFFDQGDAWSRVKQQADYFDGRITDQLLAGPLIVLVNKDRGAFVPNGTHEVIYENDRFKVFRSEPFQK